MLPVLHAPGEMCISSGTVERLHPFFLHPRYEPFTREKNQKDSARAPQQVQEPADSPWGAQLSSCSQPKPPHPGSRSSQYIITIMCK